MNKRSHCMWFQSQWLPLEVYLKLTCQSIYLLFLTQVPSLPGAEFTGCRVHYSRCRVHQVPGLPGAGFTSIQRNTLKHHLFFILRDFHRKEKQISFGGLSFFHSEVFWNTSHKFQMLSSRSYFISFAVQISIDFYLTAAFSAKQVRERERERGNSNTKTCKQIFILVCK